MIGLEETDESDYIPTSLGTTPSRQSTACGSARRSDRRQWGPTTGHEAQGHEGQLPTVRQMAEPFGTNLPPTDPTLRLLIQKVNWIEEEQNQIRTPTWGKVQLGPFTSRIRLYRLDKEVQALRISFYSGVEDPVTHIHTFQSALGCKGLTDEGQCLLFPSTLARAALNSFYRLEPGTTDRLYSADDLYTIRQGDSEPLREYSAKFSHEYSRCPEIDDRGAFGTFKSGLRASQFHYLVHSSNWTTYGELMKQAAIHAKAEHFNSIGMPSASIGPTTNTGQPSAPTYDHFPPHQIANQAPYRTAPTIPAPYATGDKRKDSFQGRQDGGKRNKELGGQNFRNTKSDRPPEVFTILNSTYEHVLMVENQMIPKPSLRKLPWQVDKNIGVFCRYHQYNGHDTESCIPLRRIVEKLISEGKLDQYLNTQLGPEHQGNRQINMISGGTPIADFIRRSVKSYVCAVWHPQVLSLTEERNSKIRRHGWEPITFSEEEEKAIIFPHSDPMIIRADIADFDLGRILIDTGRSVNVLFADVFNGLGVDHQSLNKEITLLLSFSGDVVEPIGSI
ncbi:unnamed protein product [Prunus brigantina]